MAYSVHPKCEIYLCRHGETEWTLSGQHTSTTDLSLSKEGIKQASHLRKRLQQIPWKKIISSPMKRCVETVQLCQLPLGPVLDSRAVEWNYGQYEGKTSIEIAKENSRWNLFADGAPGGESPAQVSARADSLIQELNKETGNILLFSHGHFLRALAARWISLPISEGKNFALSVASLSILSFERERPVLQLWNDTSHLILHG